MISDCQYFNDLKRTLQVFRFKLLFHRLLTGGIAIGGTFLFFVFFHYFSDRSFQLTVCWKTFYYYFFLSILVIEFFSFILYPVFLSFFFSFSRDTSLLKQVLNYLPSSISDVFVSVYNLAFHSDSISGNDQLKRAAFVQKYEFLKENGYILTFPRKLYFRQFIMIAVILLLFFLNGRSIVKIYADICNYEVVHSKHELSFSIQNDNLNVEYGKGFQLKLKVNSDDYLVDHVFICFGGGEFLMTKQDSLFIYDFEVLNNDVRFNFKALDQQSDFYKITVLPSPLITGYKATLIPPSYTGLKPEMQVSTVDFRALYGSRLKLELDIVDLDSLYLSRNGHLTPISLENNANASLNLNVSESADYALYGSNRYFNRKNLLNFTVTCIPDLYPSIQVSEIQDSLRNSIRYFYGVITDDYGFSALRFNYSVNGQTNTVVPVSFSKSMNNQEFYLSFDFAEFAGMDKSKVYYYFEVFDNDILSGPKSTRSDQKQYIVPDLNTIFDYNVKVSNTVNSALNEAEKLAGEIVSGVKELQKKMLDDNTDNWEKQQLSKDIVEKKEKLDKLLNTVKEDNLKKSDLNRSFTGQDSVLIAKQKQIQSLLDKVMDEDMKDLMKEFSKLSEEFSKEKFKNLDEKMKLTFDQMSEELDRNIELLKRFQIEEQHDLILKQVEKLKSDQNKLEQAKKESKVSADSLSELNKIVQDDLENLRNNYQDLLKDNKELSDPYALQDFKSDFEKLSQKLEEQEKQALDKKNEALSKEIKKEMDDLSNKMKQQQEQNFVNKSLPKNDIELIIQNILIILLSEEELLKQFPMVESQSVKYNELGRLQDLKRQEYKIVKDSLSVLAKSNLMLASLLSDKFYDIEIKFGLLSGLIQDNKRSELAKEQQYIISYLNDIALSLTDALQKSQREANSSGEQKGEKKGSKSGKENGNGSQNQTGKSYDQMKKYQNGLKKQLEDLISQMKNGTKGKPLQQGISNIIRENELFKKSLNDFISETGSLSNTEKQLLNEINRLLDDNIRDLANYSVSNQVINRNNMIYNKLLLSEKASKEREEFEEKRKSESAMDAKYKHPETIFNMKRKSGMIKTDFQKSDLKLNDYFKTMYNNYYIKLGNE